MTESACLSPELLSAYHCGDLEAEQWEAAASHLRDCPTCLARLEKLPSTDPVLQALRNTPQGEPPDDPAYRRAIARLAGDAAVADAPLLGPGDTLREYRLLEQLGEGGMGTVYKALHTRLEKVVALKVLRRGRHDAAALLRFEREMRAAGRLRHPHLVQATDAGEVDGVPFLVMEYVDGADLARIVRKRGPLRPADACEVVRQAAVGLAHAHAAGLIHRDIKPSNLILTSDGTVKVLDLGLARLDDAVADPPVRHADEDASTTDDHAGLTNTNQTIGTRHYMAPEQLRDSHSVDARADVYGLGCTLLYLLHGQAPLPETVGRITGPPLAVLRRMVAERSEDRFASAEEAARALAAPARGADLAALAGGTRARRTKSRSWLGWAAAAGSLAVGLGIWRFGPAPASSGSPSGDSSPPAALDEPKRPERGRFPLKPDDAKQLQTQWARYLGRDVAVTTPIGLRMTLIPPGGDLPLEPGAWGTFPKPIEISAHEVTIGQFRKFVEAEKYRTSVEVSGKGGTLFSGPPGGTILETAKPEYVWSNPGFQTASDDCPVVHVSWEDAQAFCRWLSRQEGATYRLPTSAEWRWACRAGSAGEFYFGDDVAALTDFEWIRSNSNMSPHPVGLKPANVWGLHDTIGNVMELTDDPGGSFPPGIAANARRQAHAAADRANDRTVCGGSYTHEMDDRVTSNLFIAHDPKVGNSRIGFRVVREVKLPAPQRVQPPINAAAAADLQREWAENLDVPVELKDSIGIRLVLIPPGHLNLHSGGLFAIEKPYRLGACEVTVGQFRAFVADTKHKTTAETGHGGMAMHSGAPTPEAGVFWDKPGHPSSDDHPVTQVSYTDAAAFCEWLSKKENAKYRLPTANEWRWATKAGTQWLYFFGEKPDDLNQYAWNKSNAKGGPQPGGRLKPNPWGLYDTLGNVREWTPDLDGPGRRFRIACGGSVISDARQHTVEGRGGFEDWVASSGIGFRVLRELK